MRFELSLLLLSGATLALANPWHPEADLYLRDLEGLDLTERDFVPESMYPRDLEVRNMGLEERGLDLEERDFDIEERGFYGDLVDRDEDWIDQYMARRNAKRNPIVSNLATTIQYTTKQRHQLMVTLARNAIRWRRGRWWWRSIKGRKWTTTSRASQSK